MRKISIKFRPLTEADLVYIPAIYNLINTEAESGNLLARTKREITEDILNGCSVGAFVGKEIVGYHCLHFWGGLVELRSLVVSEAYRGHKIATSLVATILDLAAKLFPNKPVFAIVRPASKDIFKSLGVNFIEKGELSDKITQDCQKCRDYHLFPRCSCIVMMVKNGQNKNH